MAVMYRCSGFLVLDKLTYETFIVEGRTDSGVWVSPVGRTGRRFFYTHSYGKEKTRMFARPTMELAYKDYLSRICAKLDKARAEVAYWESEQRKTALVTWEGKPKAPHILFLPTPEQTAKTVYAIKMRIAVEYEADLDLLCRGLYAVPDGVKIIIARQFVRYWSGAPYATRKDFLKGVV